MTSLDWESFVQTHYSAIFGFCFQLLGSRGDAEDAVQEAFMRAFKSQSALKDHAVAKAWIYSIARNVCLDRRRWWKRQLRWLQLSSDDEVGAVPAENSEKGLSTTLRSLIAALPQKQREVFVLRHWQGFSTEETAALLRIGEGAVKSHLKRAVDRLKEELEVIDKIEGE